MLDYLITVPVFLLMITVLVAAHEYGHYLFAKLNHMDVEEFFVGYSKDQGTGRSPRATYSHG